MRTTRLFGASLVLFGGAVAASAAPPADTKPPAPDAPSVENKVKSNTTDKANAGDAQRAPDARKNAPATAPVSASGSAGAKAATQAPRTNAAGSATTQSDANAQTGASAPARVNTQGKASGATAAPNAPATAAGADVQTQTKVQSETGVPASQPNRTDAQSPTTTQSRANAKANANLQGTVGQNDVARISSAIGLGFTQSANALTLSTVAPTSAFANAGLLPGDQLVTFGGQRLASQGAFSQYISTVPVGQRIPIVVMRNGAQQTIYWTPDQSFVQLVSRRPNVIAVQLPLMPLDNLGIQLDRNVPNAAVVAQVAAGSPAHQAGVMRGDAIVAVNDREIRSAAEFTTMLDQLPANSQINLSLSRNVQQNVQVAPSSPVPVTAAKPIVPAQTNPANRGPARRILRRNN